MAIVYGTTEPAYVTPSGGGQWGIKADYSWDSSTRTFKITKLHGYRSNYYSCGNGTLVIEVCGNNDAGQIWTYTDYITMEFSQGSWSGDTYWQHDGRNKSITIPDNTNYLWINFSTNGDTFNNYIKNQFWQTNSFYVGAKSYTLIYDATTNGGIVSPTSNTAEYGTYITTPIPTKSSTTSTRTVTYDGNGGTPSTSSQKSTATVTYSCTGWWNAASGGTIQAYAGNNYGPLTGDTTIYAQFSSSTGTFSTIKSPTATKTSTSTRKVTFDATTNGGTCSTASTNSTATVTYPCTGWWTAKSSGTKVVDTNTNYIPSKTQTVYAQWGSGTTGTFSAVTLPSATKANGTSTHKVTFDATTNGGTCSTASLNSTATVTYSCSGWFTAASGGTKRGTVGGTYTPSAAEKIYAQFTSSTGTFSQVTLPSATKSNGTSSRTVTINANGGSSTVTSRTSSATVTYTHSGWFTAASGGTKRGASGDKYTPSASEKIYAQFTSSTGSYSSVTLPTATECTKSGATLLGFSTSNTATTATYAPGASYTPTGDVILYAVWQTLGQIWIKKDGVWVQGEAWIKINGTWKKGQQLSVKNSSWKNSV